MCNIFSKTKNLFCLPFAGGSFYSYRDFGKHTAEFINVDAIDIPGHGRRMREPLLFNIHEITEDIFNQIKDKLTIQPYALYGHSMGALLAYLLSEKILTRNLPMPEHLFLSGRYAPCIPNKENNWHLLSHEEFTQKIIRYGGIPAEVAAEKDLMDLFVPIMKADFQAVTEYRYEKKEPLDIPVNVFIGLNENITYSEALKWKDITTKPVSVKQFSGGHFFIFEHLPEIGKIISQSL